MFGSPLPPRGHELDPAIPKRHHCRINTRFVTVDDRVADSAADYRARYNLTLTDALQVAAAVAVGCDSFLTNDAAFQRVQELSVLLLNHLEL
jgi:predicted nucleic acid-binding protein